MTIREKLKKYDLSDQAIIRHGMLDHIRDYELIGQVNGQLVEQEVRFVFKASIKVEFQNIVEPRHYLLDDRLLDMSRQHESDYPSGFVWGVNYATVYSGWSLIENTLELSELSQQYGFKLYRIEFQTNAYKLGLIFHDVKVELVKETKKTAPQHSV